MLYTKAVRRGRDWAGTVGVHALVASSTAQTQGDVLRLLTCVANASSRRTCCELQLSGGHSQAHRWIYSTMHKFEA